MMERWMKAVFEFGVMLDCDDLSSALVPNARDER